MAVKESTKTTATKSGSDKVAMEVNRRFRDAKMGRGNASLGGVSLNTLLERSYNQYHSVFDPCDRDLVEASGVDLFPSITHQKCETLISFIRDMMFTNMDSLITYEPTPVPDISKSGKLRAVESIKQQLAQQAPTSEADLMEMISRTKGMQMHEEFEIASREAKHQTRIVNDTLVETRMFNELMRFMHFFVRDPLAVMIGSFKQEETVLQYSGDKLVEKPKSNYYFHTVDPRDYYFSDDVRGNGTGAAEMVITKMRRGDLYGLLNQAGWITGNVQTCIDEFTTVRNYNWLHIDNMKREDKPEIPWGKTDTIEVIRFFGKLAGIELRQFGFSLEDTKFYECSAVVCGEFTLKVEVNVDLTTQRRRVYTSSYQKNPNSVVGYGMAQLVRDIERGYLASIRSLITNSSYSAEPMGEVDFKRIQRYISKEDAGAVFPGTMMPVDPDMSGGGRNAYNFYNLPNHTATFSNLVSYYLELADRFSGVPASLHGQPIGTGVNRTFRGIMALYSNAMKGVQSAMLNVDEDILRPVGENLHYMLRDDHKFKGDTRPQVFGLSGLLRSEIESQKSMENLQLITQLAASAPDALPGGTVEWAVTQVLKQSGVPDNVLNAPKPQPAAPVDANGQPAVPPEGF